jgi:hypothetical protein
MLKSCGSVIVTKIEPSFTLNVQLKWLLRIGEYLLSPSGFLKKHNSKFVLGTAGDLTSWS